MTWEILAALITIVSCLIALGGVLVKLVVTLTKLNVTLTALQEDLKSHKESAHEKFTRIGKQLTDHEIRIHDLEADKR